jgi:hypothetical protein
MKIELSDLKSTIKAKNDKNIIQMKLENADLQSTIDAISAKQEVSKSI